MVPLEHVSDHFLQFKNLGGFSKNIRLVFNLLWMAGVWVVWSERNVWVSSNRGLFTMSSRQNQTLILLVAESESD